MLKKRPSAQPTLKRNNIKIALVSLVLLIIFLLLGKTILFLISIQKPLTPSLHAGKEYTWDDTSTLNVVLAEVDGDKTSTLDILHFDPTQQQVVLLRIPPLTYIDAPHGYGWWIAESIFGLGQESNKKQGTTLLEDSMSTLLGLPIDGTIFIPKGSDVDTWFNNARANKISFLTTIPKVQSDMTPLELNDLFSKLGSVRSDNIMDLDLEQSSITQSKLLPDSSRVLGVDMVKLDLFIRNNLADSTFLQEGESVAVFNATSHPGLTKDVVRMITNLGGTVTMINNTDKPSAKSYIYASDSHRSITELRLTALLAPSCLKVRCSTTDDRVLNSRSDIAIVLGDDYYNYWNGQ